MQYSIIFAAAALMASANAYQLYYWSGPRCTGERLWISDSQSQTSKCYVELPQQAHTDKLLTIASR